MIKGISTDPEKDTVRSWKDGDVFLAQCEEIPTICIQSDLEGEAISCCRDAILDYINWCLDVGFPCQEPHEEVIESMDYHNRFHFGILDYILALTDSFREFEKKTK